MNKRTIGFVKVDNDLYPVELTRDSKNRGILKHTLNGVDWHTQKESIDSFFAREDVRNELISSSLDLPNTKVMLLYQFPLLGGIELLFYDENSEFIMFMADRELILQHIRAGRAPFEGEKVDKFYHGAKMYPVNEILTDTQAVFDARPDGTGSTYP